MKLHISFGLVFFCLFPIVVTAQTDTKPKEKTEYERIRGESGVDPIIIHEKIGFTSLYNDPKGPAGKITNSISLALGIKIWSMGISGSMVSVMSGHPGAGFQSALGDFGISFQNTVYKHGKSSLAVAGQLTFPTGGPGFGSQYFSFTPILTYIYALERSVILALQPQYSFQILKDPVYPNLSLLTVRTLVAKFNRTGSAYGLELKPILNFEADILYFYVTPFLSLSLGDGFHMIFSCDVPANHNAVVKGPNFQLSINRTF
ncbi:MAG: hypothetical protein ACYDH3_03615 [Candidatus Aminicenantales bacterium]